MEQGEVRLSTSPSPLTTPRAGDNVRRPPPHFSHPLSSLSQPPRRCHPPHAQSVLHFSHVAVGFHQVFQLRRGLARSARQLLRGRVWTRVHRGRGGETPARGRWQRHISHDSCDTPRNRIDKMLDRLRICLGNDVIAAPRALGGVRRRSAPCTMKACVAVNVWRPAEHGQRQPFSRRAEVCVRSSTAAAVRSGRDAVFREFEPQTILSSQARGAPRACVWSRRLFCSGSGSPASTSTAERRQRV